MCTHARLRCGPTLSGPSPAYLACRSSWTGSTSRSRRAACARSPAGVARPGRRAGSRRRLRGWPLVRAEITEEPSDGCDGERYSMTPDLGVFRSAMSANGDVLVQEDRLRAVLAEAADTPSLQHALDRLLGLAVGRRARALPVQR